MKTLVKKLMICALLLLVGVVLMGSDDAGCGRSEKERAVYKAEQKHTVDNQARLNKAQPPVSLSWSLERENINKRTALWNDPNKVSYIYLVNFGKIMAFYTVKGKVSSVNSQVTNTMQVVWPYSTSNGYVLPSPAEDGSYGSNGDSIFFFTTEGAYVEWKGDYMLSDQPLKLTQPPEMVRQIK